MASQPTRPWHVTPMPVRAAGAVIGLTLLVALIALAFGWTAARPTPHDLPIGVAGELTASQLQPTLDGIAPRGFTVTSYPDRAALASAVRNREVYGGLTTDRGSTTLLTATGASPAAAQLLIEVGVRAAQAAGTPLHTEDLAPLPANDPHSRGLTISALVLVLAGLLPALTLPMSFPGQFWLQFLITVVFSVLTALTFTVILRHIFGSVEHDAAAVGTGLTLGVLAMSLSVLGLTALFRHAGLVIGVLAAVLLGVPLSGVFSAPEMLSHGWRTVGQLLPQGATVTVLRSTAYFSGAGAATATVVLAVWAVAGALLVAIAGLRTRA